MKLPISQILTIFILCSMVHLSLEAPAQFDPLKYLETFGYLQPSQENSAQAVENAIAKFQEFFGLTVTGELNEETREQMAKPRCGEADVSQSRQRRFTFLGDRWENMPITYRISGYSSTLADADVDTVIRQALDMWQSSANVWFHMPTDPNKPVGIDIFFASGDHGDGNPFDGPNGFLAHVFPHSSSDSFGLAGDVHFDDDEAWKVFEPSDRDLLWMAIHMFGHSIGLGHSSVPGAMMFPSVQFRDPSQLALHPDDIAGARGLYGDPPVCKVRRRINLK